MATKSQREKRKERTVSARKMVEKRQADTGRSSIESPDGIPFFQIKKAGTYRINILPYVVGKGNPYAEEGDLHFERTYYVHRGIGADENSYACPRKNANKPCPICEDRAKLAKDPDTDPDLLKSLKPADRQLWLVEDLNEKDKGVQLWDVAHFNFGKQLEAMIRNADEGDNYEYFADPKKGFILKLGVTEESFAGRTFFKVSTVEFKPRSKPLDEDLVEHGICLDDCIKVIKYEDLKKIYLQLDEEDEDGKGKKGKKKSKEDDDEDEDQDDEDEDEAPKKKGKEKTAKQLGIKAGMQVEHEDFGTCDVMKVSGDGTSLTLEDEDGKEHKAVNPNDCTLVDGDTDEEDEEEDEAPKKKKKPKEEDEDDEEEEEEDSDEDEEEDEDEPSPKKKKKKPADDDDDEGDDEGDDEDDDEDEEEEDSDDDDEDEPAPKKKRKK